MNNISIVQVPPGFRFYPTDEELVDYYLRRKINATRIDLDVIKEVDLYKIEPWDLKEICRMGNAEEQNDWYFFSHKDKKYPTGSRTNRATAAGFWKATGRDKAIYSKLGLIGMRKTLVFYKGRAPKGQKSDWIMHEYRLETDENGPPQEEGWVVCRVFKKKTTSTILRINSRQHELLSWYDHQISFPPDIDSSYTRKIDHQQQQQQQEEEVPFGVPQEQHPIHIPSLFDHGSTSNSNNALITPFGMNIVNHESATTTNLPQFHDSIFNDNANLDDRVATDWRVLDKFVASQLSQQVEVGADVTKNKTTPLYDNSSKKEELIRDNASASTTSRC